MRKILTILLFTLLSMQLKAYSNFKAGGFYYRFIGNGLKLHTKQRKQ